MPQITLSMNTPLGLIKRISESERKVLERVGLHTVRDILFYFPARYSHISEMTLIRDLEEGSVVTLCGKITKVATKKGFRSHMPMAQGTFEDTTGKIPVVWFNQAYMAKMIDTDSNIMLTGKVGKNKNGFFLSNPEWQEIETLPIDSHDSLFRGESAVREQFGFPVYRETKGLTSKWIYHTIKKIFASGVVEKLEDYLPEKIRAEYHLPSLATALVWIHTPRTENDARAAQKRFAFEEIFFIQIARQKDRREYEEQSSYKIDPDGKAMRAFMERFPFTLTDAQESVVKTILADMARIHPMARLLEGDVGSGKTAVAAIASYATILTRPEKQDFGTLQVAYMAPTEILAVQHFENFISFFEHANINIGLLTSAGCRKFPSKVASAKEPWTNISRTQLLKWVENGEIPIVIGTHSLIAKSVAFKHLGLAIVDEQHRFGAKQRAKLAQKGTRAPHFLSMTATPIPRTLALTIYGDLDLSVIDQMPIGRKQVITEIITNETREKAYEEIQKELDKGRQAYVICARIDEPDETKALALQVRSVTAEAKRLQKEVFKKHTIGVLHGKMTKDAKEKTLRQFETHEIDILVATSVVEVGVNIPNATIILIEGAERFGLAQLHQLRGRVMRSSNQSYCFALTQTKSTKTMERMHAFKTAKNGFELAELDLAQRGAGELAGTKQWGISDLGMEALKNIKMVEAARAEAKELLKNDPKLLSAIGRKVADALEERKIELVHFE